MSEQFQQPLTTNTNNDAAQRKRVRTGSISGRLRTASDLEEIGMIDKYQKGYIKDLIISGDSTFHSIMEKYEKGDKRELEELIRSGCLGRRQSIDLLDDLDFDFLNGMKTDLDVADAFGDDFMFDFAPDAPGYGNNQHNLHSHSGSVGHTTSGGSQGGGFMNLKTRTASMDSTGSLSFFENLPYDANNANSLMDELQYLNRQYADAGPGASHGYGGRSNPNVSGNGNVHIKTEGTGSYKNNGGAQGGAPHVSFSRFVSSMGLDPVSDGHDGSANGSGLSSMGMPSMFSGHKGRRESWDIAAQYIQEEEDFSRGQGSAAGRVAGSLWSSFPNSTQSDQVQPHGKGGTGAVGTTNKQGTTKKSSAKGEGGGSAQTGGRNSNNGTNGVSGSSSSGNGAGGQGQGLQQGQGSHRGGSGTGYSQQQGTNLLQPGAGQGQYPHQTQGRPLATAGGTSTSTQHSSSSSSHYMQQQAGSGAYDDIAVRLGGPGFVGAYSPEQRRLRIEKFIEKRGRRVWTKKVKYDVRKNFADSRLRVKGRFVKKEDEDIMREILSI